MEGLIPLLLREDLRACGIRHTCVLQHLRFSSLLCLCPSYHSQCGFFFMSSYRSFVLPSLQVIFRESYIICSCCLDVFVGGGKLRILPPLLLSACLVLK